MFVRCSLFCLLCFASTVDGELAGGRPNAFSEGNNAFAGVVNPANTVWIENRIDFGGFWIYQKSLLNNRDNNPRYPAGKTELTYKTRNLFTVDGAVHKHFRVYAAGVPHDSTLTVAVYTVPGYMKLRSKHAFPGIGTTPISVMNKTEVASAVFSLKLNESHSVGISFDYLRFSHWRDGFQGADNPVRSVSPGNVTNNGLDHSSGFGFSLGWRWKITDKLNFGTAWIKKSFAGQYMRYRGFEPKYASNYTPQSLGAGFSYRFWERFSGRIEVLWSNLGSLPNANNNVLANGKPNPHKRGSNKSPGPGLQDATYLNIGLGCRWNKYLSIGTGLSHRFKLVKNNRNFISHTYARQVIFDTISIGANIKLEKHDIFLVAMKGLTNRITGYLPVELGGGDFSSTRETFSASLSWGYKY